jgi:hypothetical protein
VEHANDDLRRDIIAAKRGCCDCGGPVRIPPVGPPFSSGPHKGRYRCGDCWTLYWNEHPEDLADDESRRYVSEEADRILTKLRRQPETLYQEGRNRIFLSRRGTLVFEIFSSVQLAHNEYDPERLNNLVRALVGVSGKVPGYEVSLQPVPDPERVDAGA